MSAGGTRVDGHSDGRIWLWILTHFRRLSGGLEMERPFDFFVDLVLGRGRRGPALLDASLARDGPRGCGVATRRLGQSLGVLGGRRAGGDALRRCVDLHAQLHPCVPAGSQHRLGRRFAAADVPVPLLYAVVMLSAGAKHPYMSEWWQWPLVSQRPISYYYHDFRTGIAADVPNGCCVAEILALPNPVDLVVRPHLGARGSGWLAWRERNKGYGLLCHRLPFSVAAVDRLAALGLRVPFLPEPGDHRACRRGRAATVWHKARECGGVLLVRRRGRRLTARWSSGCSCSSIRSWSACTSPGRCGTTGCGIWLMRNALGLTEPAREERRGSSCPDIPSGTISSSRRARSTRSAARCSPSSAKRSSWPPRAARPIPRPTTG